MNSKKMFLINSLTFFFQIFNRLVPKNENQILFESKPDFADNANAMFHYLNENAEIRDKYSFVWMVNDKKMIKSLEKKGIKACNKFCLKGIIYLIRSKYLFVTHNENGSLKSNNQILINLWHGMPLKSMGFFKESENNSYLKFIKNSFGNNDFLIATSIIMKSAFASSFRINPRKVHITGQPRNDKLFCNTRSNISTLLNIDLSKYDKIILFCPTFRPSKSRTKSSGLVKKSNIFDFEDYDENHFHDFLRVNNILLLLTFHPFDEKYYLSEFRGNFNKDNIILITKKMLKRSFFDLYDILGEIEILITDYSSVYFDFLLLDKPIIFTPTDFQQYSEERGFLFEPYEFWTPGPKVQNYKTFIKELKQSIEDPEYYKNERKIVNDIVNRYQDDKSCKRVYDLVFKDNEKFKRDDKN
ncbi:MAG: CDP-glycerol glycerophosphotransferase family protein [Methanobacterium sp.]|nr:CDP-glycerol glycerophosphotransferase family protein [Methanobacterium sp.]